MENFSGNLARSLPYLKRDSRRYKRSTENILPPYTVITPNIGEETNIALCWLEFMRNFKRYGVEVTTTATSIKKKWDKRVQDNFHAHAQNAAICFWTLYKAGKGESSGTGLALPLVIMLFSLGKTLDYVCPRSKCWKKWLTNITVYLHETRKKLPCDQPVCWKLSSYCCG